MHLATYSNGDAGKLLAHYERNIGERDHIDREGRIYNLAPERGGALARYRELTEGLEIGAKTRPLADWVATAPETIDETDEEALRAFFQALYDFLAAKVGDERIVGAWVHLDEPGARPHMHFAFVPTVEQAVMTNDRTQPLLWTAKDERKNPEHKAGTQKLDGKGTPRWKRVQAKDADGKPLVRRTATASKLFSKADMQGIHGEVERYLCGRLGMERVGMELDGQDARKKLSRLGHADYARATAEIERQKAELAELEAEKAQLEQRKECLRREIEELQPAAESVGKSFGNLVRNRGAAAEKEQLGAEIEELERRVGAAAAEKEQLGSTIRQLDERVGWLEGARDAARGRVETLCGLLSKAVEGFEGVLWGVESRLCGLLAVFGVDARTGNPPLAVQAASVAPEAAYDLDSEIEDSEDWAHEVWIEPPEPERGTYHSWGHGL